MGYCSELAEEGYRQSDTSMMYKYKVVCCPKRYRHDWRKCAYAHATEKARRRDPVTHKYLSVFCPEERQGLECPRGEKCPLAHNVFEFWLHPARYKTVLCKDGLACKRSVCFFAHKASELRTPPQPTDGAIEMVNADLQLQVTLLQALLQATADLYNSANNHLTNSSEEILKSPTGSDGAMSAMEQLLGYSFLPPTLATTYDLAVANLGGIGGFPPNAPVQPSVQPGCGFPCHLAYPPIDPAISKLQQMCSLQQPVNPLYWPLSSI